MTRLRGLTAIAALAGLACSAGGGGSNTTLGSGAASSGGGISGGAGGKGGFGGGINPAGGVGGGGGSLTDGGECFGVSQKAENTVRPVDIIMAIDNSGSMTFEATEVQNNMNNFAAQILNQGIDVHVVIISEDGPPDLFSGSNGVCIPAPLGSGTCPNDSKPPVYQRVNRGVGSNDPLQIIIEEYPNYKQTLRQTALKYFAVVTDDNSDMPAQQFIQAVGTLDAGWFDNWRFFGVYCTGSCGVFLACAATGTVYGELTQQSQTRPGDMCQGQSAQGFATVFSQLAQTVAAGRKLDCQWAIPPAPAGQTFDPNKVNVRYTPTAGGPTDILYVDGLASCGPNGGWYYDNPQSPTRVLLCPASCNAVTNDLTGQVDVVFGCQRRTVPR